MTPFHEVLKLDHFQMILNKVTKINPKQIMALLTTNRLAVCVTKVLVPVPEQKGIILQLIIYWKNKDLSLVKKFQRSLQDCISPRKM